jgi:hypothetical protein
MLDHIKGIKGMRESQRVSKSLKESQRVSKSLKESQRISICYQ